jgi:hypothetical protein
MARAKDYLTSMMPRRHFARGYPQSVFYVYIIGGHVPEVACFRLEFETRTHLRMQKRVCTEHQPPALVERRISTLLKSSY